MGVPPSSNRERGQRWAGDAWPVAPPSPAVRLPLRCKTPSKLFPYANTHFGGLPVDVRPKVWIRHTHESLLMAPGASTLTEDNPRRQDLELDYLRRTSAAGPEGLVQELEIWHPLAVPPGGQAVARMDPVGSRWPVVPWPEGEVPGKALVISTVEC